MPTNNDINFLQGIRIPQLGTNFAQEFQAFCEAIKNNFERLISVQYTKGNDGNSVEAKTLIIDDHLDPHTNLSVLGYGLVSTIFGDGAFKGDNYGPEEDYHDGLNDPWRGMQNKEWILHHLEGDPSDPSIKPIAPVFTFPNEVDQGGRHALPQILDGYDDDSNEGFTVNVVIDDHNGKAYLAVPYVFIDGRIEDLNRYIKNHTNADDTYKNFYDFSTVVYGVADYNGEEEVENWKWTLWRNDLVPKLYFDDNVNEFCWQVNGQQTGVTAQGIKGDDGYTPSVHMAMGTRSNDTITITKLQIINEGGIVSYEERTSTATPTTDNTSNIDVMSLTWKEDATNPNKNVVIRNIDFVLVFYNYAGHFDQHTGQSPTNFAFLGRPIISANGDVTIACESNAKDDIFDAIDKQVLRNYLTGIFYIHNNTSTHYADLRGLYIPATFVDIDPEDRDKAHMLYSERYADEPGGGFTKLRISPVTMDGTHSSQGGDPWVNAGSHVGLWRIDYNLEVTGGAVIGGDLHVQGNVSTQGNLGVQGNAYVQNNLTVGGDTYLQGDLTIDGQMTATGAPFRPIRDTHMACISRFKDIRCEITRNVNNGSNSSFRPVIGDAPKGIIYTTSLATTLNIRIGRVNKIQGIQGAQGNEAWSVNNLNTAFHKALAIYGGPNMDTGYVQGMWYEGGNSTQGSIQGTVENITDNRERHNAPKMYDVIEYNIPITIAKTLDTYVTCVVQEHDEQGKTPWYAVQYDTRPNTPVHNMRITNDDSDIYERQYQQDVDGFNTPSFRIQEYGVGKDNPSDNFISSLNNDSAQGAISELKDKFTNFGSDFHAIQGTLDYMGIPINYHIDFYIRIFEAAAIQGATAFACNVNTTFTILPVGYISFIDPEDHLTYRAPIYGGVSVKNYTPSTLNKLLFPVNKVQLETL